jgi:hypothetical protein
MRNSGLRPDTGRSRSGISIRSASRVRPRRWSTGDTRPSGHPAGRRADRPSSPIVRLHRRRGSVRVRLLDEGRPGGSLSRKRIEPVVTSSGTIFLRSVYRDRDWIYHDHVIVRIGDQEYVSDALPATSSDVTRRETRRQSSSDRRRGRYDEDRYVSETVRYRGGSDNGIVRAIAEAGDAKVAMRLAGGPRVFDKTLSNDEKRAFADAMELATLLRRRATPATGDTLKTAVETDGAVGGRRRSRAAELAALGNDHWSRVGR